MESISFQNIGQGASSANYKIILEFYVRCVTFQQGQELTWY